VAEQNAAVIREQMIVRLVVGNRDFTAADNRAFSEHFNKLLVEHSYKEIPDVGHEPMALFQALGESNWVFYRKVFGEFSSQWVRTREDFEG
jgi:hypothetical protein